MNLADIVKIILLVICVNQDTLLAQPSLVDGESRIFELIKLAAENTDSLSGRQAEMELAGFMMLFAEDEDLREKIGAELKNVPGSLRTPEILIALAYYDEMHGNFALSADTYLQIILKYPTDKDIQRYRIALAESLRKAEQYDQALAQLELLQNQNNGFSVWAQLEIARLYRSMGNQAKASSYYQKVINRAKGEKIKSKARDEFRNMRFNQIIRKSE